jgi:RimJ/RimL family protein N-acetyltransferase
MYTDPKLDIGKQIAWLNRVELDPSKKQWIIVVDGVDIGFFNFYDIDWVNRKCGWGYYIGEDGYQGKGIGKAVECSAYDYAFVILSMNKAWAEVFDWNSKVIEIHKHMGCLVEANYPQEIYKDGLFHDITRVCMLKNMWYAQKKPEYVKVSFE